MNNNSLLSHLSVSSSCKSASYTAFLEITTTGSELGSLHVAAYVASQHTKYKKLVGLLAMYVFYCIYKYIGNVALVFKVANY